MFDEEFISKLKAYHKIGTHRRTERSSITAKVLVEVAIESGREVYLRGHSPHSLQRREEGGVDMRMYIEVEVSYWRDLGVKLQVRWKLMETSTPSFQINIPPNDTQSHINYARHCIKDVIKLKTSVFPTEELSKQLEKEEFLKNRLLLL